MIKSKYKGTDNMDKIKNFFLKIFSNKELTKEEEQDFLKRLINKLKEN